jgi:hypothetical protein
MANRKALAAVIVVGLGAIAAAQSQQAKKPMVLTATDYAEITQLSNRYAWAIDTCINNGYEYADLYTDDGAFSVSQEWGKQGARLTKGREALAGAAGGINSAGDPNGKKDACKDPTTTIGYGISHIIVNHVITPTPDGAVGRAYLLAIGVGGDPTKIERQGGYEDVYVKTKDGWRFKSRTHVFPNQSTSVQFGGRGRRGAGGGAGRGDGAGAGRGDGAAAAPAGGQPAAPQGRQ